jgi:hypothetical protein
MKYLTLSIIVIILLLQACSPGIRVTNSWKNPTPDSPGKKYKAIFITALTDNQFARDMFEENLAEAAQVRGYTTTRSGLLFTPTFTQKLIPSKEQILQKVQESNCDAIFTVALVNKEDLARYVQGEVNTAPSYGWYGSFGGYYGTIAGPIYTPGYYTNDRVYYLVSNLFDAKTEKILWSVRTEAYNPSSIEKFSKEYTATIIKQLERDGIIKK